MNVIRPANPAEADFLSALALRSKAHWGYSAAFIDACKDELTFTAEHIRSDHFRFFVAEADSTCVGFYALNRISADDVELEALFVEPAFIGRGFGGAMMDHAKQYAATWGALRMIIQGDPNTEAFYHAAGGVRGERRESASIRGRFLPLFTIDLSTENPA